MSDYTRDEWERRKALAPRAYLAFNACNVAMLPHPENPEGPRIIPWVESPGRTCNLGRNAIKRLAKSPATWGTRSTQLPPHRFGVPA